MTCRLFHDWGKWVEQDTADIEHGGRRLGVAVTLRRVCQRCGEVELKIKTAYA